MLQKLALFYSYCLQSFLIWVFGKMKRKVVLGQCHLVNNENH